jgi:hypothetical protein
MPAGALNRNAPIRDAVDPKRTVMTATVNSTTSAPRTPSPLIRFSQGVADLTSASFDDLRRRRCRGRPRRSATQMPRYFHGEGHEREIKRLSPHIARSGRRAGNHR